MKIIYIPSGYGKIYTYFDQWIIKQLKEMTNGQVRSIHPTKELSYFKTICRSFQPDLVITLIGDKLPNDVLDWLKRKDIPLALWLTEDPYYIDHTVSYISYYDFVFTIDISALRFYQMQGFDHVYHLPLGTDPETFSPKPTNDKFASDLCLIGYPYENRVSLITKLLKETPYRIIVSSHWKNYFTESKQLKIIKGWLSPQKVSYYYSNAKICLNTHRSYQEAMNKNRFGVVNHSINNRTFDIAACAAFQLIEEKEDISTHFALHNEIVSFHSEEDAVEKIDYYMNAEKKRQEIGENAHKRVLQSHTFYHRITKLLQTVMEQIAK
ncbi:CgeB family protein [Alkalihalobacterium bogoriense]|uniref:CgeB family protein n=1 Tax=Alkalihalobacterium bogoriense TaxID=246272 RepID=UPI00047932F4|nr:glycosyltransferase [Alkalihalobacterium bogoriense]